MAPKRHQRGPEAQSGRKVEHQGARYAESQFFRACENVD